MKSTSAEAIANVHALGQVRFMGVDLAVGPGALVPRPETELLGEGAVRHLDESGVAQPRVVDMCCGSGNLVCGIAMRRPDILAWASDLTPGSVQLARANATRLGIQGRVEILQGDLFVPLQGRDLESTIDLVVCNPPYISTGKLASERAELLVHEPREAFDGGPYGISIFQRVIRDAVPFLKPGAVLMFEIGAGQHRQVEALFKRHGAYEAVRVVHDTAGEARVIIARRQ